ncbi:MAG: hypothetical protein H0X65_05650 [Gemmatimonadetes bacterium]|nr:hypothetical protein [Gemmatimonadota bacterium]
MLLSFAALLLAFQVAAGDTLPAEPQPDAAALATSYLDAGARELVQRARERRETVDRSIHEYSALARERMSASARVLGRERQIALMEMAANVHWRRFGPGLIELLGARQSFPMVSGKVTVPEGLRGHGVHLAFDPAHGDLVGAMFTDTESSIRHPLAPGSEANYRFRSGDTTVVRLADGRRLRVAELQVIPRRKEFSLGSGSLWFDLDTHALVRALVRPARPWDISLDVEDAEDIPGIIRPIRGEIRYITIEYGLWEQQWWLPRLIAMEGVGEAGALGGVGGVVRYERTYSGYRVAGKPVADSAAVEPREEAVLVRCPKRQEGEESRLVCRCRNDICRQYEYSVPADTASLLASPELPPSIFAGENVLLSPAEMREIGEFFERLQPPLWQLQRPTVDWSVARLDLLRYNRVEGLSIGARADVGFGPFSADATARLGLADRRPDVELGFVRERFTRRFRLAGYHRLDAVDPAQRPLGLGNSLSALLLGRDDGDYLRATGAELIMLPPRTRSGDYALRLFAEQQRGAEAGTQLSVPHLLDRSRGFRPNLAAERADQLGASVLLRTERGLNPTGFRWGADLFVEGSTGTFDFARQALTLRSSAPLMAALLGSVEVAGGSSIGRLPAQRAWYLGGPASMRGYAPTALGGEAFWRTRAEVATTRPGARLVGFSDVGWAGPRDQITLDAALLSAGVGASFLDGLIRLDLARALRGERGWRADLYVNGAL